VLQKEEETIKVQYSALEKKVAEINKEKVSYET